MCRLSDAELYCVSIKMRSMSELMQFETGMSIKRYLPPSGTAGLALCLVSGCSRLPAPPPSISASTFFAAIRVPPEEMPPAACCVEQEYNRWAFHFPFSICHFPFVISYQGQIDDKWKMENGKWVGRLLPGFGVV